MKSRIPLSLTVLATLLSACTAGGMNELDSGLGRTDELVLTLGPGDPAFSVPEDELAAALLCSPFDNPETNPILLVHGTFTNGPEQYSWNWLPYLEANGFDACVVSYPDRGMGDQQESAEYIVHAVLTLNQLTGRKVDMAGHSQGASMPRWAIRWWPSVREALDDFVLHAPPSHGTQVAGNASDPGSRPAGFWQFAQDSNYVAAMNSVDETPGEVDYTVIYALSDELVQPVFPVPTAALDLGMEEANTVNISLQEVCPGRSVDHVSIGTTDSATLFLTLDAFSNDGPADFERAGGIALCAQTSFVDQGAEGGSGVLGPSFFDTVPQDGQQVDAEPPLKPYVVY